MFSRIRNERGATLLENAFALPVFFLFVMVTLDLIFVSYQALTVQFLSTRVLREVVIGPTALAGSGFATREDYIVGRLVAEAANFRVTLDLQDIQLCWAASRGNVLGNCATPGAGGTFAVTNAAGDPGALLAIRTTLRGNIVRIGALNITNTVVARNEHWNT